MEDKSKVLWSIMICTSILLIAFYCYSLLFVGVNIIQNEVKIASGNSTQYIFCTVETTDSWVGYLKENPELEVYTPPDNYTNTAIVHLDNNERWIIVYDHDIPFSSIVVRGEIVYRGTISEYSGIIMVKVMPNYSWPHLMLIKHREITRFVTFLIFIFWISLLYISLSEWSRRT